MKNIRVFLSENFQFWEVKFSIYLNRHVFVMFRKLPAYYSRGIMSKECSLEIFPELYKIPRRISIKYTDR